MRVNAINYPEPGEEYIFAVLDENIDAEKYIDALNAGAEAYNADIDIFWEKKQELNNKYGVGRGVEELTGMHLIPDTQYPRFPGQVPKGTRDIRLAFPDIQAERERIDTHNQLIYDRYHALMGELVGKVEDEIKPLSDEINAKYPMYIGFSNQKERIYYKFQLTTIRKITNIG